jgi:hypothetical protein
MFIASLLVVNSRDTHPRPKTKKLKTPLISKKISTFAEINQFKKQ